MPTDQPLTLLQAAVLDVVRPLPAGRTRTSFAHPGVSAPASPVEGTPDDHDCLHAAVVVDGARRVWFPCRSHEGGFHHYAAHWPKCPAPWCRLPYSHYLEGTMHDIPSGTVEYHDAIGTAAARADDIVALCTLQMSWGGLFDGQPADDYAVHLVRQKKGGGTPGPTLCGIDRFAEDAPGWSVGGGLSGPGIIHKPCPGCAAAAREQFPGLPVAGMTGATEMAAELGVEVTRRG